MIMIAALLVAGAIGAWARFEVSARVQARAGSDWPWGTLVVNLTGTVLFGALFGAYEAGAVSETWLLVGGSGFCGAFTTFSTWMVGAVRMEGQGGGRGVLRAATELGVPLLAGVAVAASVLALA